jgi:hypothetical protein
LKISWSIDKNCLFSIIISYLHFGICFNIPNSFQESSFQEYIAKELLQHADNFLKEVVFFVCSFTIFVSLEGSFTTFPDMTNKNNSLIMCTVGF